MRIACPACNAAYQVPDEHLRAGRVVRCARCGTDWAPIEAIPDSDAEPSRESMLEPAAVEPVVAPEPEPVVKRALVEEEIPIPRPPVPPPAPAKPRRSVLLPAAWVVSVALVGGAAAGLYVGRERVMKAWPPSTRAYAALGLGEHPAALEGRE